MIPWYRHPKIQTTGLVILALFSAQILQVILFLFVSIVSQNMSPSQGWLLNLLSILPVILSLLAGGAFLGRLRPDNAMTLWSVSAVANSLVPIGMQALLFPDTFTVPGGLVQWTTIVGNILFWFVGCVLGSLSHRKTPNPTFDRSLIQWTAGITGAVIMLYGLTLGSLIFSKGYRMAKAVELPLPDDVEEIKIKGFEPGIARARRFRTTIASGDTSLQDFFCVEMAQKGWTDITEHFQSWPITEWHFQTEVQNNQSLEYAVSGGYWQDVSGKVVVTMVLQGEKVDVTKGWEDTDWNVIGIILSRPFTEPRNMTVKQDEPIIDEAEDDDTLEKQVNADSMQEITE